MSFLLRCWTHRDPIARTSLPVASSFCLHHVPFEVQPVYAPQEPRTELKLAGYSVSNRVRVKIQRIGRVGEVLDRLVTAGATDIANIEYDFGASRDSAYDRGARWNLFPCLAVDARHANGESRGHSVREPAPDSRPA